MTTPPGPTVLITPGTPGVIRPRPDSQIDARTLQTGPPPADSERILITAVGAAWCSEFDALPLAEDTACAPGSLILTYGRGAAPGSTSPAAAVLHLVEPDGHLHVAGIWLHLTDGWIEFLRPTVALTARLLARTIPPTP
ncbi:hypothetical protein [Actinospica robiniae]|uniref:hypothetical protein n=1 Tax=Actinospica robiniae TaxID=304901 RepID=UPI0003F91A83|nr:hypothetical protein [Actinospica robiniae]